MDYKRHEIGAGIFLLVSFVILAVMIFAVSDIQSLFKKKKEIKVLFQFSDGIEKNAPVRLSGLRIGKVESVRVAPEFGDKVELILSVFQDTIFKKDTKASVKSLGLVGGKYVELTGGSPGAPLLEPGGTLTGEEALKLEDIEKAALEVVGKIRNIANNIDRLIGDPAMTASIKKSMQNLQDTTANVKSLTTGTTQMIVQNVSETTEHLKNMTSEQQALMKSLNTVPELLKKIDETTANLKAITDKTNALLGDNKKQIDDTLENIKQTTQNLKELTDTVKKDPWKLIRKP